MGCGSSGQVVAPEGANGSVNTNGKSNGHGNNHDDEDLPTVVLPETPAKKPPIAFEIPLEEFDGNKRVSTTPPPHVQRLLQPPQAEISLPDIEEKLAEAELRRQTILQQRAASAQKRSQKMMKSFSEMDQVDSKQDSMNMDSTIQYSNADSKKMDHIRKEDTFIKKTDPMTPHPWMTNTQDELKPMTGSKPDPVPMGMGKKVDVEERKKMVVDPNKRDSAKRGSIDSSKYVTNTVRIPPEPDLCEDKNI